MQANVKLVYQMINREFLNQEQPYINILPLRPDQAYEAFNQKQLSSIRKTEKVPFSCIRQLILMYTLQNEQIVDLTKSVLLKEKEGKSIAEYDLKMNRICDYWGKQKIRIQKLQNVNTKYIEKRLTLVSLDYQKDVINQRDFSDELKRFMEKKEIDKVQKIKNLTAKDAPKKKTDDQINQINKTISKIEDQTGKQIFTFIKNNIDKVSEKIEQFRQKLLKVGQFKLLVAQYEKVLILILAEKHIKDREYVRSDENILKIMFVDNLTKYIKIITDFFNQLQRQMFSLRMLIKHEKLISSKSTQNKGEDIINKSKKIYSNNEKKSLELEEKIQDNIYLLIFKILKVIEQDKHQIIKRQKQIMLQFYHFLPGYYNAKEVEIYLNNQSSFDEILKNQKIHLTEHLKNNFGLMVPYNRSRQFSDFLDTFKVNDPNDKSRSYIKILIKENIQSLDRIIRYINDQYPDLYKLVCSGNDFKAKSEITKKVDEFNKIFQSQSQPIELHILESLRRLKILLNK